MKDMLANTITCIAVIVLFITGGGILSACDSSEFNAVEGTWEADPSDREIYHFAVIDENSITFQFFLPGGSQVPDCWEAFEYTLTSHEGINYVLTQAGEEPVGVTMFRSEDVLTITFNGGGTQAYFPAMDETAFEPECD